MTKGWHWRYNKVHMATRWTIRHGLMPLWFKDLMNITEKLQFIDPTFRRSCLVPSSPLMLWEWCWDLALPSQPVTHVFPRVKHFSCFVLRVLIGCPWRFPDWSLVTDLILVLRHSWLNNASTPIATWSSSPCVLFGSVWCVPSLRRVFSSNSTQSKSTLSTNTCALRTLYGNNCIF